LDAVEVNQFNHHYCLSHASFQAIIELEDEFGLEIPDAREHE